MFILCLLFFLLHFVQMRQFSKVTSAFMNWIILWFRSFHFCYPWAQKSIPLPVRTLVVEQTGCRVQP